jgi:hypothetical protein
MAWAAVAQATATRTEYVAQVDPICQATTVQARQTLRSHHLPTVLFLEDLRSDDRKAQLRIAKIFQVTIRLNRLLINQIAAVAPPQGDEATITKWVADLNFYVASEGKAAHAVRIHKARRAYRLILRAIRPLFEDNEVLQPFGFQYCAS